VVVAGGPQGFIEGNRGRVKEAATSINWRH
jgi:hypothetical protein